MMCARLPVVLAAILAYGFVFSPPASGAERPNILWLTAEDMSPTLGCYGDDYATTPNIDKLATESVRYTHAFATAPVCSPSRSCLISGCYAPSLGTQQMRSAFPLPQEMKGFPALLREQGYFTSNNVKTDYNTSSAAEIIKASWNESSPTAHWRNRKDKSQPFFSVFNFMTSHQSRTMVWPREQFEKDVQSRLSSEEIHDPRTAPVPPYYPETPLVRETIARFYDCVTAMDKEVGELLRQLEEDGLAEDTIVFYFSDHGSGMPRHKRVLLDSGMRVPLLIRFPEKYRQLAPKDPGTTTNHLVSFVDFPPTVLHLAGIVPPDYMQGQTFLGRHRPRPRTYVFGHRDRIDEAVDLARSARDERYLYIRNYMPQLGYKQPSAWPEAGAIHRDFDQLANQKNLPAAQWQFVRPRRDVEELYDCENDPLNLQNLATSPDFAETLERMRAANAHHLQEARDLGFIPEIEAWKLFGGTTPWEAARSADLHLDDIQKAAADVGVAAESKFLQNLHSELPAVRYWGAVGLAARPSLSEVAKHELVQVLRDDSPAVRMAAADALGRHGRVDAAVAALVRDVEADDLNVALYAARAIELMGEKARAAVPAMQRLAARAETIYPAGSPVETAEQDLAMFCGFSANAFLSRVPEKQESSRRSRPNILLIVSEDNGPELGCYGDPYVKTPVLDALAAEGVRFANAYVPQAGCSQSRAALLTGLYPHQNGQIGLATWKFRMYRPETPNIVRILKDAGYTTGIIGKLHINPASAFPFDYKEIPSANFARNMLDHYHRYAENFFQAADSPFFLSVNYPDAHRPFIRETHKLPLEPLSADDVKPLPFLKLDSPFLRNEAADYYNCMSRLDSLIGDLLSALERSGKAKNTLIVYLGDHGADMLRGKRTSYEGGLRIPLIVKWPKHTQQELVRDELVSTLDIVPTLLEAAHCDSLDNLPGTSLTPLLKGEKPQWRQLLFTEFHTHSAHNYFPQRTVRDARFKLIQNLMPNQENPGVDYTVDRFYPGLDKTLAAAPQDVQDAYERMRRPPEFELYDLKTDPSEIHNLADDKSSAKEFATLKRELSNWREETNDPMLNPKNVMRLKKEIDACFVDGLPQKDLLTLDYPDYFFAAP